MSSPLAAAARSLEAGDHSGALETVVKMWISQPSTALAGLAEKIAAKLAEPVVDQPGWLALAAQKDPRAVFSLYRLRELGLEIANDRIRAFDAWPPNPLLGSALIAILEAVPFTSDDSWSFWSALFPLLQRVGDPRFVPLAARLPTEWSWLRPRMHKPLVDALRGAVKELRLRFPDGPPPLASADQLEVDRLLVSLAPRPTEARAGVTLAGLLADVYADPTSDAPRLVLADFLQERGDPRGELIAQVAERRSEAGSRQ